MPLPVLAVYPFTRFTVPYTVPLSLLRPTFTVRVRGTHPRKVPVNVTAVPVYRYGGHP